MPVPKKTFVLRLDERTYKALEKWSADEFRSINGQLEWLLHKALKEAGRLKQDTEDGESERNQQDEHKK